MQSYDQHAPVYILFRDASVHAAVVLLCVHALLPAQASAQISQRRTEAECARLRSTLLRAEEQLGAREAALSPNA